MFLRRLLGYFLLAMLSVVLLAAGAIWWAVHDPHSAWTLVQKFLPADLRIESGEVQFKGEHVTALQWNVDFLVRDLMISKGEPRLQIPIDELGLRFSFSIWRPATRADFAKVTMLSERHPVVFVPSAESAAVDERSLYEIFKANLDRLAFGNRYASMRELNLRVREFQIGDVNPLRGSLEVVKPSAPTATDELKVTLGLRSKAIAAAKIEGLVNQAKVGSDEPFARARVSFEGFRQKAQGDLQATFHGEVLTASWRGPWSYSLEKSLVRADPVIDLQMRESGAEVRAASAVKGLPAPLRDVEKLEVVYKLPLQNGAAWSEEPATFTVAAPLSLYFIGKDMREPLEKSCQCKIPERLDVSYSGSMWMRPLMQAPVARQKVLRSRLAVEGLRNKLFTLSLAAEFGLDRDGGKFRILPKLDSEIHILSYKGLRNFLDAQNILIPAPFDVLEGTVDIQAHSEVSLSEAKHRIPVEIKTLLSSEHQRVNAVANVNFDLDAGIKSLDILVSLMIADLQVQLPPLDPIAGVPRVVPDSRVAVTPPPPLTPASASPRAADRFRVQVFVEASTAKPGAIRLLSKYAKPEIPITLAIQRANDGVLTGSLQLEPFQIQYLRRTVSVERLRLLMDDEKDTGDFPIDGKLRVDQTQYRIFIELSGNVRQPIIRLTSEPYLTKNEIISVLLYDRTSDQLVSNDAETVGHFESALADRAIGLFGIWAFASTPIRSFSYNPVTKVYAATVQLADGLSAGVGTNWEEAASLEVRKRVSRRWVLTASWAPSESAHSQVGKLVLQWEKRF